MQNSAGAAPERKLVPIPIIRIHCTHYPRAMRIITVYYYYYYYYIAVRGKKQRDA